MCKLKFSKSVRMIIIIHLFAMIGRPTVSEDIIYKQFLLYIVDSNTF